MREEIWKDIKDYEGLYQVSNTGKIRSINYRRTKKNFNLRFSETKYGHKKVSLYKNKVGKTHYVHHLVYSTFLNRKPRNKYWVIDHIDNDKANNHINNLQIITQRENSIKERKNPCKLAGVTKKSDTQFIAVLCNEGSKKCLGTFISEKKAHDAWLEAKKNLLIKLYAQPLE